MYKTVLYFPGAGFLVWLGGGGGGELAKDFRLSIKSGVLESDVCGIAGLLARLVHLLALTAASVPLKTRVLAPMGSKRKNYTQTSDQKKVLLSALPPPSTSILASSRNCENVSVGSMKAICTADPIVVGMREGAIVLSCRVFKKWTHCFQENACLSTSPAMAGHSDENSPCQFYWRDQDRK